MHAVARLACLSCSLLSIPALGALTPEQVLHLAKHPEAVMIDSETCELRDAIYSLVTGRLMGEGQYVALFHRRHDVRPFAEGVTLADSTVTIRFKAMAGDRFFARAYKLDKSRRNIVSAGPIYRLVCEAPGQVEVGDVEQVKQSEGLDKAENTSMTGEKTPHE